MTGLSNEGCAVRMYVHVCVCVCVCGVWCVWCVCVVFCVCVCLCVCGVCVCGVVCVFMCVVWCVCVFVCVWCVCVCVCVCLCVCQLTNVKQLALTLKQVKGLKVKLYLTCHEGKYGDWRYSTGTFIHNAKPRLLASHPSYPGGGDFPSTHWIGGWLEPWAGLEVLEQW